MGLIKFYSRNNGDNVTNDRQENPGPSDKAKIWKGFWTPLPKFFSSAFKIRKMREDIYKYWWPSDESPRVGPELPKKRRRIPSSTSSSDPNGSPSSSDSGDNVPKDPQASTSASGSGTHNDPEEPIQRLPIQHGGSEAGPSRPPDEITTASNPSEPNENPPSSAVNNPFITVWEEYASGSDSSSNHKKDRRFKTSWFKKTWFKKAWFKKPSFKRPSFKKPSFKKPSWFKK